jgi:hypothetical protein
MEFSRHKTALSLQKQCLNAFTPRSKSFVAKNEIRDTNATKRARLAVHQVSAEFCRDTHDIGALKTTTKRCNHNE